jgi:hypothetical protein
LASQSVPIFALNVDMSPTNRCAGTAKQVIEDLGELAGASRHTQLERLNDPRPAFN